MTIPDTDIKIRILLAAKKLFAEQGFDKTTVRQICEAAGANVALVSYYFGGKENVFGALFEHFFPNDKIATINKELEPLEGIRLIVREVARFRQSDPQLIRIIQHEILLNTVRIQKIREHVVPMWQLLRHWLEKGQAQGLFVYQSVDSIFMSIIGILLFDRQSAYWQVLLEDRPVDIDEMIEEITRFILGGLQAKPC